MTDYLDRLERLTMLFERGALSKEEFEREKAHLLTSAETASETDLRGFAGRRRRWLFIAGGVALAAGTMAGIGAAFHIWRPGPQQNDRVQEVAEADAAITLDTLISFRDVTSCAPSDAFASLLEDLERAASTGNPAADGFIRIAGAEDAITPITAKRRAGGGEATFSALPLDGIWHGLHVREIRTTTWNDGLGNGFRIRFAEGPGQSGSVLRQLGVNLPKLGTLEPRGDRLVGIEADSSGSALVCVLSGDVATDSPSEVTQTLAPAS